MNSSAFKDIDKLESDQWSAADNLRANSKLTYGDYFLPVLVIKQLLINQREIVSIQNQKLRAARDLLLPRRMSGEVAV